MAILLAFSNDKLMAALHEDGAPDSGFMSAVASLFHFLLIQTVSLMIALITKSTNFTIISAVGFFMMTYGSLCAIAPASILFRISRIFNTVPSLPDDADE
jgi:hypothetical protein